MTNSIKKAVILINEPKKALYPLEVCTTKELFPLGNIPIIHHIINELIECKVEEVILILPSEKKEIIEHFNALEKEDEFSSIKFSYVLRKKGTKTGTAILKVKEDIDEDNFFLIFPDTIFSSKKSASMQLLNLYRTSQKIVLGLAEIEDENPSKYYIAEAEKIANRFYKIKKIFKKPNSKDTESRLVLVPRYIFTPLLFEHLKNGSKATFFDAVNSMIASGKTVYGYVCEGDWFSLKQKERFLEAQRYFVNKNHNE